VVHWYYRFENFLAKGRSSHKMSLSKRELYAQFMPKFLNISNHSQLCVIYFLYILCGIIYTCQIFAFWFGLHFEYPATKSCARY